MDLTFAVFFFLNTFDTNLFYCVNIPHFSSSFFYTLATHLNEYYIIHMVIPDYLFYQYWNFYLLRSNLKTENYFKFLFFLLYCLLLNMIY